MSEIIVSVLALTYNQVKYVEDMLIGFINQKTTFHVEYIIHDDASTDGTKEILERYENEYPGFFTIIYEKENQWSKGVKITQEILLPKAKGKYIAFCEGDDYWIDKNKLQKQKDFLDNNPEFLCVAHDALMWNCEENWIRPQNTYDKSRCLTARDVIDRRFPSLATASKMHRRYALDLDPMFLNCGEVGDMPTDLYVFSKGKIFYLDEIMSVYRYKSEGSWSLRLDNSIYNLILWRGITINFLKNYNDYTDYKYEKYVQIYMSRSVHNIVDKLLKNPISRKEFDMLLQKVREDTYNKYDESLAEIQRIVYLLNFSYSRDNLIDKWGLEGKTIYIFGAKKYAGSLARLFDNYGIEYEAFVVADVSDNPDTFMGKRVLGLDEYAELMQEHYAMVIGAGAVFWEEIEFELKKKKVFSYIAPFLTHVGKG